MKETPLKPPRSKQTVTIWKAFSACKCWCLGSNSMEPWSIYINCICLGLWRAQVHDSMFYYIGGYMSGSRFSRIGTKISVNEAGQVNQFPKRDLILD